MAVLPMLNSCRHKDLYMDEDMSSRLVVVYDWQKAPDARPSSMGLYMYDETGNSPMRFILPGRDGGEIRAPFGTYHAVCLNADGTDWMRMRGHENIESMEIYTDDAEGLAGQALSTAGLPRAKDSEEERMAKTPGMLWGWRRNAIDVVPHTGTDTIMMYPDEKVSHYIVDIYDVDNLSGVRSTTIDATLSGMAEGYNIGRDEGTGKVATMTFTLSGSGAANALHGEFLTFGECPGEDIPHYLTVYLVLKDGSRWWHSFDVSRQVSDAPDPRHVHIIIHGLPLPEPPEEGGSSMSVNVNEWQPVYIGLKM